MRTDLLDLMMDERMSGEFLRNMEQDSLKRHVEFCLELMAPKTLKGLRDSLKGSQVDEDKEILEAYHTLKTLKIKARNHLNNTKQTLKHKVKKLVANQEEIVSQADTFIDPTETYCEPMETEP